MTIGNTSVIIIQPVWTVADYASSLRMQLWLNCLSKVPTLRADYISGIGKDVIIISVLNKSDL